MLPTKNNKQKSHEHIPCKKQQKQKSLNHALIHYEPALQICHANLVVRHAYRHVKCSSGHPDVTCVRLHELSNRCICYVVLFWVNDSQCSSGELVKTWSFHIILKNEISFTPRNSFLFNKDVAFTVATESALDIDCSKSSRFRSGC